MQVRRSAVLVSKWPTRAAKHNTHHLHYQFYLATISVSVLRVNFPEIRKSMSSIYFAWFTFVFKSDTTLKITSLWSHRGHTKLPGISSKSVAGHRPCLAPFQRSDRVSFFLQDGINRWPIKLLYYFSMSVKVILIYAFPLKSNVAIKEACLNSADHLQTQTMLFSAPMTVKNKTTKQGLFFTPALCFLFRCWFISSTFVFLSAWKLPDLAKLSSFQARREKRKRPQHHLRRRFLPLCSPLADCAL